MNNLEKLTLGEIKQLSLNSGMLIGEAIGIMYSLLPAESNLNDPTSTKIHKAIKQLENSAEISIKMRQWMDALKTSE